MPIQKVQTARQRAADLISRFLGKPTGNAAEMAIDLLDDEIGRIVAAGEDRETARQQIKDVLTSAYDRRRDAAALDAVKQMQADTRRGACCRVLQEQAGLAVDESLDMFHMLDAGEQEIVLALAGQLDAEETLLAVCKSAFERATFAEQVGRRHESEETEDGETPDPEEKHPDDTQLETAATPATPESPALAPSPSPAPAFSPVEADPVKAADEAS